MRIVYLSRGQTIHDQRFLEQMNRRGYDVHFISYYPAEVVQVPGVKIYHFSDYQQVAPFPRFRALQYRHHLKKLLHQIKPDVLHSGWLPDHGFYGAISGFHPTVSMVWGSDVLLDPQRGLSYYWRIRYTLAQADQIISNAEHLKARTIELARCDPGKITLFPFGIELDTFHPDPSARAQVRQRYGWEENEILIMNRNFKSIYGIEYFLDALPAVLRAHPSVRVFLGGSGDTEAALRERVQRLGLGSQVRFLGRVTSKEMAAHLNAADVYVSTSLSDGTSSSLLEAFACALPVVVSDLPPNQEWIQNGVQGYRVPIRDSGAIAKTLIALLGNAQERQHMAKTNWALAQERADWNKNFSVLERLYQRMIDAHRN